MTFYKNRIHCIYSCSIFLILIITYFFSNSQKENGRGENGSTESGPYFHHKEIFTKLWVNVTLLPRLSLGGSHTNLSCKHERVGSLATSSTVSLVYDSVHVNLKLRSRHEEGAFLQIFYCNFFLF